MKIHGQSSIKCANLINAYQKADQLAKNKAPQRDSVELSAKAQEIAKLQKKAAQLPEVREELVQKIKEKVRAQTYQVQAEKLAEKLLAEFGKEKI